MEISYTYLRSKEVVNLTDGKRLGRVCDVVFRYPENVFLGIVVPGNIPGGTTITGCQVVEEMGFRAAAINAVQAATNKSREL